MDIKQNVLDLILSRKSLHLSTINAKGLAEASYAPFYFNKTNQTFIVLLSGLSEHTSNLQINKQAAVLIIEDECESEQIFARKRLSYQVTAKCIDDDMEMDIATGGMLERFGDIVTMLTSLPDFKFFSLTPENGKYIKGFGGAYIIENGLNEDIKPAMDSQR